MAESGRTDATREEPMISDERAVANRIIIFGLILITIGLLSAALNPAYDAVSNETSNLADTSEAQTGLAYTDAIWEYKSFVGLMLGVAMLFAGALFESRGGL